MYLKTSMLQKRLPLTRYTVTLLFNVVQHTNIARTTTTSHHHHRCTQHTIISAYLDITIVAIVFVMVNIATSPTHEYSATAYLQPTHMHHTYIICKSLTCIRPLIISIICKSFTCIYHRLLASNIDYLLMLLHYKLTSQIAATLMSVGSSSTSSNRKPPASTHPTLFGLAAVAPLPF